MPSCEVALFRHQGGGHRVDQGIGQGGRPFRYPGQLYRPRGGGNRHERRPDEAALRSLREETPLGRLGTPAEIAAAIAFLASEESDFITGQVLSPNGGLVI